MLLETIRYFRKIGFFSGYESISDGVLAQTLENFYREKSGKEYDPSSRSDELCVLEFDENRVWWEDTEADVCNGNEIYIETLKEWGAISRGAFTPENLEENWASEEGPITVTFTLNGQKNRIYPRYLDDYIDVDILGQINKLIRKTGLQFAAYEAFDQTAFVVALTTREKHRLERERGWRFAKLRVE